MKSWSHSALEMFAECPRKYWHLKVAKDVKEDFKSPVLEAGTRAHEALEHRVVSKRPLPVQYQQHERFAAAFDNLPAMGEQKMAINTSLAPVAYFAPDAWGRAVTDVLVLLQDRAWVNDWKTGKIREKKEQLAVNAIFIFQTYPEIQVVKAHYTWLDHGKMGEVYTFHRQELNTLWQPVMQKINAIDQALQRQEFMPKENHSCKWCPVKQCHFNKAG